MSNPEWQFDKTGFGLRLNVSPNEKHALNSFLLNNGVSVIGAQQFAGENYVTDPKDRKQLASLLAKMVQGPMYFDPDIKWSR